MNSKDFITHNLILSFLGYPVGRLLFIYFWIFSTGITSLSPLFNVDLIEVSIQADNNNNSNSNNSNHNNKLGIPEKTDRDLQSSFLYPRVRHNVKNNFKRDFDSFSTTEKLLP